MEENELLYCELCGYVQVNNLCEHMSYVECVPDEEDIDTENTVVDTANTVDTATLEELLIALVETRPALWDSRLPISTRSKGIKEKLWMEIYHQLGKKYSVGFLQKKWRNLRDTFIKTKADISAYIPSGSEAKKKKKWKHFDILSFLGETVSPRQTSSSLEKENKESPSTSARFKESEKRKCDVEDALINAIKSVPIAVPLNENNNINPICIKISQILDKLPDRQRALAEIDLLKRSYDLAFPTEND